MRIRFTKCHGSGNDFPLIDGRALSLDEAQWAQVARALNESANARSGEGAFNPAAAAALSGWKEP